MSYQYQVFTIVVLALFLLALIRLFYPGVFPFAWGAARLFLWLFVLSILASLAIGFPVTFGVALMTWVTTATLLYARLGYRMNIALWHFWHGFVTWRGNNLNRRYGRGVIWVTLASLALGFGMEIIYLIFKVKPQLSEILLFGSFALMLILGSGWYLFSLIKDGGRNMPFDIFSIVDEPEKLEKYFREEEERGLPPIEINVEPEKLSEQLKEDVIGQDAVIDDVVKMLARRTRLRRQGKPLATFLFAGPTGVGKTELSKSIAKHLFQGRLIRMDMNEFSGPEGITRFIGSPPGYLGSDQGGQLTQAIKRTRMGVILFDEIEKCDRKVYDAMMTLLDEGRITEQSSGETMDATRFVIIMTTNAKHKEIGEIVEKLKDDRAEMTRAIKDALGQQFKKEQLARIDGVYGFSKLSRRARAIIIARYIVKFAEESGVQVARVDSDLIVELLEEQVKIEDYGVRELARLIEHEVVDAMLERKDEGYNKVIVTVGPKKEIVVTGVR